MILPSLASAKVIAVAVAALGLLWGGYRIGAGLTEAKYLKAAEARQSDAEKRRTFRAQGVAKVATAGARQREVIIREIEKPVYRDRVCRLTPDGLRILNEILTGEPGPAGDRQLPPGDAPRP